MSSTAVLEPKYNFKLFDPREKLKIRKLVDGSGLWLGYEYLTRDGDVTMVPAPPVVHHDIQEVVPKEDLPQVYIRFGYEVCCPHCETFQGEDEAPIKPGKVRCWSCRKLFEACARPTH